MRPRFLLPFLAGCAAPTGTPDLPEVAAQEVEGRGLEAQVVFYNVENLFDTTDDPRTNDDDFTPAGRLQWTADRYATKLSHLAQAISWSGDRLPDLIGLAEVENRAVVQDLASTSPLDGGQYEVVHFDSPDERGIDVALLVKRGVGEVTGERALRVDLDGDHTRDVLYARLGTGGTTWHLYVCHWPSRREGPAVSAPKRLEAALTLREHLDEVRGPGDRVLIMGDFNDTPTDASIQKGLGATCDPSAELVALMCVDQPEGHGSHNFRGDWAYLDQFITDPVTAGEVASAKALWDQRLLFRHPKYGRSPDKTYSGTSYKGGYSDHLPIVLRLR